MGLFRVALKRYPFPCCVIAYMTGIIVLHFLGLFPRPGIYDLSRLSGSSQIMLEGRVLDSPVIRWNQTRFLMQGHAIPMTAFSGRTIVTLSFSDYALAPGDWIRIRGWPSIPRTSSLTHDFDERSYWATRKVFSMLKVWSPSGMTILKPSSAWSLKRAAWRFHKRYQYFWQDMLPWDDASLLLGITMGARGILPADIKEACIRAGVYHIVVVSGQNMSLIVSLGVSLLLLLQVPPRHAFWICFVPIIFYSAAVGGDPPVVRAAAMALVGLSAAVLGRDIPRYYPLLLAAAWILVWEPEALLGASFQLSFGATLSILAILPLWEVPLGRRIGWRQKAKRAGLMGLAVYLGLWPFLVFYFHRLSVAGFVANWTIFPLSGVLMVIGLLVGTWGLLAPATVPFLVIQLIQSLVHRTLLLIYWIASKSWAVYSIAPLGAWTFGLYYGLLFGILFLVGTVRRKKTHA